MEVLALDPADPHNVLERWSGRSLDLLAEEVEETWFRESHPEAFVSWRRLLKLLLAENIDGKALDELLNRPAFSDVLEAVEGRGRRRCLDPEVEDFLSLIIFLRRQPPRPLVVR